MNERHYKHHEDIFHPIYLFHDFNDPLWNFLVRGQ